MHILALNSHHGGSHRAFLDGWQMHSRHQFTTLTLPGYKWKWRMRHAALTFAKQLHEMAGPQTPWDAVFCTDMLNLAEFHGLCSERVRCLPSICYFHENQLTYPTKSAQERDLHYAFTNLTNAAAATELWFNSEFHLNEFLAAANLFVANMPDFQPEFLVEMVRDKAHVSYPGIREITVRAERRGGPLRIVWVSRWEHDKNPDEFFAALRELQLRECPFHVSVLGERFRSSPECFETARDELRDHVLHWGFVENREEYVEILRQSDVVVSSAHHEFFGIAVVEAVSAGCFPIVPRRLAYPEVLGDRDDYFYDGSVLHLAQRLEEASRKLASTEESEGDLELCRELVARFSWPRVAKSMDDRFEKVLG